MPQFIRAQGMDPALAQMGQQIATANNQAMERSRLNAGNYLKNLRADAQAAGYSLSEWAKKNESGVKGALFTVSGRNRDVAESKFQELINGPENRKQMEQRLEDKFYAKNAPQNLDGKNETYSYSTKTIPAIQGREGKTISSDELRSLVKNVKTLGDLEQVLYNDPSIDFGFNSETQTWNSPEGKEFFDWRTKTAKMYGEDNFTGTGSQNDALIQFLAGSNSSSLSGQGSAPENSALTIPKGLETAYSDMLNLLKGRKGAEMVGGVPMEEALKDPQQKERMRNAAIASMDGTRPGALGAMTHLYTPETWKELFTDTSQSKASEANVFPSWTTKGQPGSPAEKITTKVGNGDGIPGFYTFDAEAQLNKLKKSNLFSEPELHELEQAYREKESAIDLRNAQTTQLWNAIKNPPQSIDPRLKTQLNLFEHQFESFQDTYGDVYSAVKTDSARKAYLKRLAGLTNQALAAGFYIPNDSEGLGKMSPVEMERHFWNVFTKGGKLPTIQGLGLTNSSGAALQSYNADDINGMFSGGQ